MNTKKLLFWLLFSAALPLSTYAQGLTYSIDGKIPKFNPGDKIFLAKNSGIDSVLIKDGGKFTFNGAFSRVSKANLLIGPDLSKAYRFRLPFYLEGGKTNISSKDSLANATIVSGRANADHAAIKNLLDPIEKRQMDLNLWYRKLSDKEKQVTGIKNDIRLKQNQINKDRNAGYVSFLETNPDSPINIDVIRLFGGYFPEYDEVYPVFQKLSSSVKESPEGKAYLVEINAVEKVSTGRYAPDFAQADTSGKIVKLSDYKGKFVLVDFWASWCGPCRMENPNVVRTYNQYKGKGFTIIGISLDNEKAKNDWLKAIHQDKLENWAQLSDLKGWYNEVARLYAVRAIPNNYLISPEGKIIARNLTGDELGLKLKEIFEQ